MRWPLPRIMPTSYSTHGWCMVEANCTAQMGGMQIITQTGRKAELEALIAQM